VDADSPVYVSGDAANSKKFKMIKTLREGGWFGRTLSTD
jgi:hypothetical protein